MNIAFDIDGTLWKIVKMACKPNCVLRHAEHEYYSQVPDYDLIQVLRWFHGNGDNVFVWSAGGMDYAQQIVNKLGLTEMVTVIPKKNETLNKIEEKIKIPVMDVAFDDCDTNLAKVDIHIKRPKL